MGLCPVHFPLPRSSPPESEYGLAGPVEDGRSNFAPCSDLQSFLAFRGMETTRLQATEIAVRSPHISIDLTRAQVCIMNGSRRALSDPARRIC